MVDDNDDDDNNDNNDNNNNTLTGKIRFLCSSEHLFPTLEPLLLPAPYAYNFTQLNWLFQ